MSQTDLGMEDAEKTHASGPDPQDSITEVVDSVTAGGEKISCATDVASNGGHEVGKPSNEDEGQTGVEQPLTDDINLETQATEQTEAPNHEEVVNNSSNEKLTAMSTEDEKEAANRSILDMEVDTREEASKPAASESEEKERKPCLDPADVIDDLKEAEDMVNDDISDKKVEQNSDEIHECVEAIEDVKTHEKADSKSKETTKIPVESSADETHRIENGAQNDMMLVKDAKMEMAVDSYSNKEEDDRKGQDAQTVVSNHENEESIRPVETSANNIKDSSSTDHHEFSTPNAHVRYSPSKAGDHSTETAKNVSSPATLALMGEGDDGTLEEQSAFVKEVESFYRERSMDFKQPKFYGQPLNCLKLWRAVVKLGGYDKVTALKLWRQVGESFHPPKTCTTVSWTFRIFYEKSLLEFERQKTQNGELQLPVTGFPEALGGDSEGSGYLASGAGSGSAPGRARRDSAARAMQGWHAQRLLTNDEVGEPVVKDKNLNNVAKREKTIKSSGPVKQKRTPEMEHPNKVARTETPKQLVTPIVDVGPPADWVKINVLQTQDCFEVYALVPGLLREEVRVQSDPAGRVVITGQPEQVDNPWGITPFKKVVSLPERIDPLQTSAVVSMHGRLFVRVPFEQSTAQPNTQA